MKKLLIILGMITTLGANNIAKAITPTSNFIMMSAIANGMYDDVEPKKENKYDKMIDYVRYFRKEMIVPIVKGKEPQEIVATLLNMSDKNFDELVSQTTDVARITVELTKDITKLTESQKEEFLKENTIFDTWANVLMKTYVIRK